MTMQIAIVGDYCDGHATHRAMLPALRDAGAEGVWIPTTQAEDALKADGVWLAPGSPYDSFENVLALIRFARERRVPFLGTCGGFQHVLIEFARNVAGMADADSAEHTGGAGNCVVVPVVCPISTEPDRPKLSGGERVKFFNGSRLREIMNAEESQEQYFCNFEENPQFRARCEAAGLKVSAVNPTGVARAVELPDHPFFLATQFQPQLTVKHPLLAAFAHLLTESA
ncbi:MAG: gamma-glutamyl-gamma-aminobutyrate hydrolase family protein [Saprospiraceae bacterium]